MAQTILTDRHRDRILTNSAAEFLETRPETVLGPELVQHPAEFVPELDSFFPSENLVAVDYQKRSKQKLEEFQQTLQSFRTTLAKKKVHERYGINLKDDYTIGDVLEVADTIQKQHKASGEAKTCMGIIRRVFRATGENAPIINQFLQFVPSGDYTSPICGGLTMIMGSLERMESLRLNMYNAIAEIPKTMSRVIRHALAHYESPHVKYCLDAVWVAIFTLLEAIIGELTANIAKKMKVLFQGAAYAKNVDDAIAELKASVADFESEATTCVSQKLGQINTAANETWQLTKRTDSGIRQLNNNLLSIKEKLEHQWCENQKTLAERRSMLSSSSQAEMNTRQNEVKAQQQLMNVLNHFYSLFAASRFFDPMTGTMDKRYLGVPQLDRPSTPTSVKSFEDLMAFVSRSPSPAFSGSSPMHSFQAQQSASAALTKSWLRAAGRPNRTAIEDLRSCVADITATPTFREQDQIGYILASDELGTWLSVPKSQLLAIQLSTGDQSHFTPASYAAAVLVRSLQHSATSPILSHFCVSRGDDPLNRSLAGGNGMLIALIAQLLQHFQKQNRNAERKPGRFLDLSFIQNDKWCRFGKARDSIRKLLDLLDRLLKLLAPTSETVYIIVDSIWKLQTHGDRDAKRALKGLFTIASDLFKAARRNEEGTPGVIVKVVVTEPFQTEDLYRDIFLEEDGYDSGYERKRSRKRFPSGFYNMLYVPEDVPGGDGAGINTAWVEEEVQAMIEECSGSGSGSQSGSPSSDSESESSDESDNRTSRRRSKRHDKKSGTKAKKSRNSHGGRRRSRAFSESEEEDSDSESESD